MIKRGYLYILIVVILLLSFTLFLHAEGESSTASINLQVENVPRIFIDSPLNQSYYFAYNEEPIIDLNVSNFSFVPDTWWYTLIDLDTNQIVNDSVIFNPLNKNNITATEGSNKLEVYANDSSGKNYSAYVIFDVVLNSAPIIQGLNDTIYVCENQSLNYTFSVLNYDLDALTFSLQPSNPFYIYPTFYPGGEDVVYASIISGILPKSATRQFTNPYNELVSVDDGVYSDSETTSIQVIEINNAPNVENVGVQTIWTHGDNSTFLKRVSVNDTEDGNESSENITFSLTWSNNENLFDISNDGLMNFTASEGLEGIYNLTLCVNDSGLGYIHPNISLCGQDGGPIEVCQNFSLTITDENRAPTIIDHYPSNLSLTFTEGSIIYFNITDYDPDKTFPDVYWYFDNQSIKYEAGTKLSSELWYTLSYSSSGHHTLSVNITDGLLNDSLAWNLTILNKVPPKQESGGGGGGGGMTKGCSPIWVCENWEQCSNLEVGVKKGDISQSNYRKIKSECLIFSLGEPTCGFQKRNCIDLNNCNSSLNKPEIIKMCKYTQNPTCNDGIKNCHHGSCEILVDCGGPCKPCPTCSDGIQNQGEQGVDCGGPCPWKCPPEQPKKEKSYIIYILIISIILLLLAIIIKLIRIWKYRKKLEKLNITRINSNI